MKMSRRAQRMERHHKRTKASVGLNMVSLMDIFTILVFFLLIHSSDVEVLPSVKSLQLPEASADQLPKQTVIVMVNDKDILVQGRKVASVASVYDSGGIVIKPLKTELDYQVRRSMTRQKSEKDKRSREITIMGDKKIPYRLLKRIMITCLSANYNKISLAVIKKTEEPG